VAVHDTASSGKQAFIRSIQSQDKDMAWHVDSSRHFQQRMGAQALLKRPSL